MEGEHTPTIIRLILSTDLALIQLKDSLFNFSFFLTNSSSARRRQHSGGDWETIRNRNAVGLPYISCVFFPSFVACWALVAKQKERKIIDINNSIVCAFLLLSGNRCYAFLI